MRLFQFSENDIFTFFAVVIRFGTMLAVMPFVGDRMIITAVKILFPIAISLALYPALISTGTVVAADAGRWAADAGSIAKVVALESLFGIAVGFCAKIFFETIQFGSDLVGNFMGFSTASLFDPSQESQSQVISRFQTGIAMLIFLALDGHHLMLRAGLESYQAVPLGRISIGAEFSRGLIQLSGEMLRLGVQLAAPVALTLFAAHIFYGIMAKAMPQLNILVLSFSISAFLGMIVLYMSIPEFSDLVGTLFGRMGRDMSGMIVTLRN